MLRDTNPLTRSTVESAERAGDHAPGRTPRDVIAEVARVLVAGGISLYRLQPVQASLESWFLQVTSRLGETQ